MYRTASNQIKPGRSRTPNSGYAGGDQLAQLFRIDIHAARFRMAATLSNKWIAAPLSHGMTRWQQGYELVEVIRELGIVERSILDHGIEKFFEGNSQWLNSIGNARKILGTFFE